MNRGTALLLAMAALLAHSLAIHHDALQRFAAPYEFAHVAYRLGRNLVHHGELVWNLGGEGGLASYPSPLVIGLAALGERLYLPVTSFCQAVGMIASLWMIGLSASFSTNRFAGIIPPLLFVVSGTTAAAAGSGTEFPLLALFVTMAYVSFEHRWRGRFAAGMALAAATRPEALVLVVGFLLLALLERVFPRKDGGPSTPLWTFVPVAAVSAALFLAPAGSEDGASAYATLLGPLLRFAPERWGEGAHYLWDFTVSAATPLLVVYPLLFLVLGKLSGAGARALGLAGLWCGVVVLSGGGPTPYGLALGPALPLIFIAVQQGVLAAIDTHQRFLELATWTVLTVAVSLSAIASKFPGPLGPIPAYSWHRAWMTASTEPDYGRRGEMGRLALDEEIRLTARLRSIGGFLRRHLEPESTLLTPWPGAVGYLSRVQVRDLFQRPTPWNDPDALPAWVARQKADVVAAIQERPDYVLPGLLTLQAASSANAQRQISRDLQALDEAPGPERTALIDQALNEYELIAVPVDPRAQRGQGWAPTYLLRRADLDLAPKLEIAREGDTVIVSVAPRPADAVRRGVPQLAWLTVEVTDASSSVWKLAPTGAPRASSETFARCGLVLTPSERPVELFRFEVSSPKSDADYATVAAYLTNPGATPGEEPFALVSPVSTLELR